VVYHQQKVNFDTVWVTEVDKSFIFTPKC